MVSKKDLLKENEKYKNMLITAKNAIEQQRKITYEESKEDLFDRLASRVAAIEFEHRMERIATIIGGIYPENEMRERTEDFAKSALPLESIDNIVKPLRTKKK